jgi:hypothetical protein
MKPGCDVGNPSHKFVCDVDERGKIYDEFINRGHGVV